MTTSITPDPSFRPEAREYLGPQPFVSLWIEAGTCINVPLTPEGREFLHQLADQARLATLRREVRA